MLPLISLHHANPLVLLKYYDRLNTVIPEEVWTALCLLLPSESEDMHRFFSVLQMVWYDESA